MKKLMLLAMLGLANQVLAGEILTIQSTITGSQEQPKVISIVPWQKPEDPNYFGQENASTATLPNMFRPLDRSSFAIEMRYISVLKKIPQK